MGDEADRIIEDGMRELAEGDEVDKDSKQRQWDALGDNIQETLQQTDTGLTKIMDQVALMVRGIDAKLELLEDRQVMHKLAVIKYALEGLRSSAGAAYSICGCIQRVKR